MADKSAEVHIEKPDSELVMITSQLRSAMEANLELTEAQIKLQREHDLVRKELTDGFRNLRSTLLGAGLSPSEVDVEANKLYARLSSEVRSGGSKDDRLFVGA